MDYMSIALAEAKKAMDNNEVPVGAVIVKNGVIIGRGHNTKEKSKCVTRHAEIIAIEDAEKNISNWRLEGTHMYVTLEPCPMCMGAILQSRIEKIHIGAFNKELGSCGTIIDLSKINEINKFLDVVWEYDDRCSNLMSEFFLKNRK